MSDLKVYPAMGGCMEKPCSHTRNALSISARLGSLGVVYKQFEVADEAPDSDASQDEIIEAHRPLINTLMQEHAFVAIDVLNIAPDYPRLAKLLRSFQDEHEHPETEARLLLAGSGWFHLRAAREIYAVKCMPGDFISLPAKMSHWFEMDTTQPFCTVRLYSCVQH